jgi:prepilin-type N-terminal cleavage/methylation domain-containing protein
MAYSKSTPASMHILCINRYAGHSLFSFNGGFTLIEIIIVIVILAIAAMTAIPMLSSAGSVQIRSAANMIAADLEYAKSMAISRGQDYSVEFDESSESYSIYKEGDASPIDHPVKKGFPYTIDFKNDGRLNKVDITFNCLGSPYYGGTINLNADGSTATITVEPVTGYISIN